MDEFVRELKESAAGLHDGMGGHADYCAMLMKEAADRIASMQGNATAKALALKAVKAMQHAETERADANERDAARYQFLAGKYHGVSSIETDSWGTTSRAHAICFYVNDQMSREGSFDDVVDRMKSFVPSRAPANGVQWEKSDDGTWKKVT